MSPQDRRPLRRALVAGACLTAAALGSSAGVASASDTSIVKTIAEHAEPLAEQEVALTRTLDRFASKSSLSGARSAQRTAAAITKIALQFRDEIREDDGSTEKGIAARDALLPTLTTLGTEVKRLDRTLKSAIKDRKVSSSEASKITSAKLRQDKAVGKALGAVADAVENGNPDTTPDGPATDPAE